MKIETFVLTFRTKLSFQRKMNFEHNPKMMKYGTKIYPIVAEKFPELAGKITGMFLESGLNEFNKVFCDNESYLQKLCENPDFMDANIEEAITLLKSYNTLESIENSVKNKFKNLIFRLINHVRSYGSQRFLESFPHRRIPYRGGLHSKEWNQYGVELSEDFHGCTSPFSLRETDKYKNKQMPFSKQGYAVLDPITLEMIPAKLLATPRVGDLICGIVDAETGEPFFDKWFVCSEQFYRCYTLILFKNHVSFKNAYKRQSPDEYWMSGNRLMTNSYLKWLLSLDEHKLPIPPEENKQRCWALRSEPMSVNWVHIYCAMVKLVRYKEFPSASDVPMNKSGLTYSQWHLPENWTNNFVKFHSKK